MPKSIKDKISASRRGIVPWNKGRKNVQESYWLGKKRSEETIQKISKNRRGKANGSKHPFWVKDRTQLCERRRRDDWRNKILFRDGNKCRISNEDCKGRLEAHHILSWGENPKLRYDINNGITLCHFHHPRKKEDVKKLSPYFKRLVALSEYYS